MGKKRKQAGREVEAAATFEPPPPRPNAERGRAVDPQRNAIVDAFYASEKRPGGRGVKAARAEYLERQRLLDRYEKGLPRVAISRCPHCGEVLDYVLDVGGLDGMWWNDAGLVETPPPDEPHHKVVLGAIDFHGRQPSETEDNGDVMAGPPVPFVVPDLLALPGMIVVVSQLELVRDDTAYVMAYFSRARIDPVRLHQPWARKNMSIPGGPGRDWTWATSNDTWDFELQPWIDAGKLVWIEPGDRDLVVRTAGACPYVGLPGERERQVIMGGEVVLTGLPTGEMICPFGD